MIKHKDNFSKKIISRRWEKPVMKKKNFVMSRILQLKTSLIFSMTLIKRLLKKKRTSNNGQKDSLGNMIIKK